MAQTRLAYSAPPAPPDRQAQPKTPPPRQIPVIASSPQARRARIVTPSAVRLDPAPLRPDPNVASVMSRPCPGGPPTVTAPQRGVPAERRQENCRLPNTAPSGRHPAAGPPDGAQPCLALVAFGGFAADPSPAAAAGMKVVVVVGSGRIEHLEVHHQRQAICLAGPRPTAPGSIEIYSPNATWAR